jgi:pimeloyl-ACP methyl ester carboxylesterase
VSNFNEINFISNDGLTLYARDYPAQSGVAKCPIICIHGLTRNSSDFEDLAPWLTSLSRRVIAVDVRGRGLSAYDPDSSNYKPMVYARDIIKMMSDLGIARAVFIGTSMGGIITLTLALLRLNLIAAAILNDIGPSVSRKGLNRIAGYAGKSTPVNSWSEAASYIKNIVGPSFPDNTEFDWATWARRSFKEDPLGNFTLKYDQNIAQPLKNGKIKSSSLIAKIAFRRMTRKRPTLLIRGAISDLIEAEQADAMRAAAPAMHYAEVPRVGHAPMLMEAEAQLAIRDFLALVA